MATDQNNKTETFSQRLGKSLAKSERRDWELWVLALSTVIITTIGLMALLLPAILTGQRTIELKAEVSVQLVFGLLVLILLLVTHLIRERIRLRSEKNRSLMEGIQYEIAHAAMLTDPLTNVFNRAAMEEILVKEFDRLRRTNTTMVFLYTDINEFKHVNTRFGHMAGDLILAEVGAILKQSIRGCDFAIRIGGDEFLAVLVDTNLFGGEVVKDRINRRVSTWNTTTPLQNLTLSVSIGVFEVDGSQSFDDSLSKADARMYAEKMKHHARNVN